MHPFIFFAIVLIAIWILSSIASAISKQQDAARRRQVRQTIDPVRRRQQAQAYRPPPPPLLQQQQLNPQYQFRHPEMLAPRPRPVPQPQQQQQRRRAPAARRGGQAPPPIPVLQADDARRAVPAAATGPAKATAAKPTALQSVKAPAISRWLNPSTLRQQFILTEVFQPPLAMREERLS